MDNKEARKYLASIGAKIKITYSHFGPNPNWTNGNYHNVYRVRVDRNHKTWSFDFYNSLRDTWDNKRPTVCDVLSVVEKYDPGTIDDFVFNYGYEVHKWSDVQRIQRIYRAVKKEFKNFNRLFGDVADEMREVFN